MLIWMVSGTEVETGGADWRPDCWLVRWHKGNDDTQNNKTGHKGKKTELDLSEVEEKDNETRYVYMYIQIYTNLPT